jgi:hypothetical protein
MPVWLFCLAVWWGGRPQGGDLLTRVCFGVEFLDWGLPGGGALDVVARLAEGGICVIYFFVEVLSEGLLLELRRRLAVRVGLGC